MKILAVITALFVSVTTVWGAAPFLEVVSSDDSSKTELLLTIDDLVAYQNQDHIFELNDRATAALSKHVATRGYIWAAGARQYGFYRPLHGSSMIHKGVTLESKWNIEKKKYVFQISLGFPNKDFYEGRDDPRNNKMLIESLRHMGKLGGVK